MHESASKHILLVVKANSDEAAALAGDIAQWLQQRDCRVSECRAGIGSPAYADPELALVVVLGGDGTMLGVARRMVGSKVPLLGINFGRVGFLAEVQPDQWEPCLAACLAGEMPLRPASALAWRLIRDGREAARGHAVNDVVLGRSSMSRLVSLGIYVDDEHMCDLRSDGLILSTAIGSSGYSVSAGGPLLYPSLRSIVFTPICPFLNTIPPIIFPGKALFSLDVLPGSTESYLTIDGQEGIVLCIGDTVEVTGKEDAVFFAGAEVPFFERLRTRGFVTNFATGGRSL